MTALPLIFFSLSYNSENCLGLPLQVSSNLPLSIDFRVTLVVGTRAIWNETADSVKNLMRDHNMVLTDIQYFREPYAFNREMFNIAETTHAHTRSKVTAGKMLRANFAVQKIESYLHF